MPRLQKIKILSALLILVITCSKTWAVNSSMFCPPILNITVNWIELLPFIRNEWKLNNLTGIFGYIPVSTKIASYKCGCPMLHFNYQQMNISSSEEIEIKIRKSLRSTAPELYFPIFANRKESTQYQRPFLGLFQSPGPAIVHVDRGPWHEKISSINMVLQTWPILSVFLSFGILAGFIVWAIEHRRNPEDFPVKFPHGVLVGIWWSFVTMTTVGYGDKTTRTLWGRMFAVLWMIIGTIVMSMFTGQITASITSSEIATVNLMNKKIAVPKGMKTFLGQQINLGARYFDMAYTEMQSKAKLQNIEYFLIHDYEVAKQWIKPSGDAKIVKIVDRQFVIGMIVTGDYEPAKDFYTCLQREIIDMYQIKMAQQKLESSASSSSASNKQGSGLTSQHIFLIATAALVVFLVLLGFLWKCTGRSQSRQTDVEQGVSRPTLASELSANSTYIAELGNLSSFKQ